MIIASALFLLAGIVLFVIGLFSGSNLSMIVMSLGASALAALTLVAGVLRDRKRVAPAGLATSATYTGAPAIESIPEEEPIRSLLDDETQTLGGFSTEPAEQYLTRSLSLDDDETAAPLDETVSLDEPAPEPSPSVRAARAASTRSSSSRSSSSRSTGARATARKPAAKTGAAAKKTTTGARGSTAGAKKTTASKASGSKTASKSAAGSTASKAAAKKPAAKKTTTTAAKKPAARKPATKKTTGS